MKIVQVVCTSVADTKYASRLCDCKLNIKLYLSPTTHLQFSKTKDTAACSQKTNKGLQNFFSGNLQLIGVARIFDWGGLNQKSHAMTSSRICLLALNQDFAKKDGLN